MPGGRGRKSKENAGGQQESVFGAALASDSRETHEIRVRQQPPLRGQPATDEKEPPTRPSGAGATCSAIIGPSPVKSRRVSRAETLRYLLPQEPVMDECRLSDRNR